MMNDSLKNKDNHEVLCKYTRRFFFTMGSLNNVSGIFFRKLFVNILYSIFFHNLKSFINPSFVKTLNFRF